MNEVNLFSYWPVLAFALLVVALNAVMLIISFLVGEKHKEKDTDEIYESGISITGNARTRFSAHFYIVAMFFVIFDVESLFIIAWALVFRDTGWAGYWGMLIFIIVLLIAVIYEWKTGALDFGPNGKKILEAYRRLNRKKNSE